MEHYLTERHKEIDRKYDYRYSRLTDVFGKLLHENRLREDELRGLREDKLKLTRSFADFLAESDAAGGSPFCKHHCTRTSLLLWRAGRAGSHIGTLCDAIHRQQGEVGVRRILGVLSLAKKYGTAAVDEACAAALEMGVQEYRFVRRYLERCPTSPA